MLMTEPGPSSTPAPAAATFWDEVDAVFAEAVALGADSLARARLIAERCADRPDLRSEVEALLSAHERAGAFLGVAAADEARAPDRTLGPGTPIGAWRLVEQIGQGGMADVYRAERADGLFGHAVAIKVTRSAMLDPEIARRVRIERQILASLQHPHIVTLLDGGTLPDGRAYLVMELVSGAPITRDCRDRRRSLEERLRLFRQVCAAVHHAHRHGIVHRDLKPANILVTTEGVPKVLDFGVAKLLASTPVSESHTETGLLTGPLTPNYASPEQLRGLPVTTASDIYALAILLYEIVTGGRPYETTGQPLDRVIDLVLHTQPAPPSAWRSPDGEAAAADVLPYDRRRLRGDLDAIVMKGLAKEPERRYASAEELAADVGRALDQRPVLAQGPSTAYVLRRLASRHKVAVACAGIAIAAVVVSLAVAVWQRQVAERERLRSEQRFGEVRRLANTLIFQIHDAIVPLPGSTPVRKTIVDEALRYLEQLAAESAGDTALQLELARAYLRIGRVQGSPNDANLGDPQGGARSLDRAIGLLRPLAGRAETPLDVEVAFLEALLERSLILFDNPRPRERATEALRLAEQLLGRAPSDPRTGRLVARASFMLALQFDPPESFPHLQRAAELSAANLQRNPDDLRAAADVASVERVIGAHRSLGAEYALALPHLTRARELDERRLAAAPDDRRVRSDLAADLSNLGDAYSLGDAADLPRAQAVYRETLRMREAMAAADPRNVYAQQSVGWVLAALARVEARLGRPADAHAHLERAVEVNRRYPMMGAVGYHLTMGGAWLALGESWRDRGRRAEACRAFRLSLEDFGRAERLGSLELFTLAHVATPREQARRGLTRCLAQRDRG
jgi:serine/threonine protein kinase